LTGVRQALDRRDSASKVQPAPAPVKPQEAAALAEAPAAPATPTVLDRADLSLSVEPAVYQQELEQLQKQLFRVEHELYLARVAAVIVFEGWDAGGKGGAIRRLTRGLDPRGYEVVPVAAPNDEEKAHHYLWRFWRNVPKDGHITIFDRSWYGRVLVERVEGFCYRGRVETRLRGDQRVRAPVGRVRDRAGEILAPDRPGGAARRFREREETDYKKWKITAEDWRNRNKREQYEPAVVEMLERTSTTHARGRSSRRTASYTPAQGAPHRGRGAQGGDPGEALTCGVPYVDPVQCATA